MRSIVQAIGSLQLLILGLLAGVLMLRSSKTASWGRRWLATLGIVYWAMSTLAIPLVCEKALTRGYRPLEAGPELEGVLTIVALSGGSATVVGHNQRAGLLAWVSFARVLEAARAYRLLRDARLVAAAGVVDPTHGRPHSGSGDNAFDTGLLLCSIHFHDARSSDCP